MNHTNFYLFLFKFLINNSKIFVIISLILFVYLEIKVINISPFLLKTFEKWREDTKLTTSINYFTCLLNIKKPNTFLFLM